MMKSVITTVVVVMATCLWLSSGASIEDARRLHSDLLFNYSKDLRPVLNQSQAIVVKIIVFLINLAEINDVEQSFTVKVWINVTWRDEQLVWNASAYGDISTAHFNTQQLWRPSFFLPDTMDDRDPFSDMEASMSVSSGGSVEWTQGAILKTICPISVRYFPYDTQKCEIVLVPQRYMWTEMVLVPSKPDIQVRNNKSHNVWIIAEARLEQSRTGIYSSLTAKFVFARRPAFHVLNTIVPVALLSLLSVLVFLLPAESGERVGFAFTSLLSITMYMSIVSSQLPRTSDPLPLVTLYLTVLFMLNVVAVVATCLSLLCYHMYQGGKAQPQTLQNHPAIDLVHEMNEVGDEGGKNGAEATKKMWVSVWHRDWAALLDKVFFFGLVLAWTVCTLVFMVVISSGGCGQDDCLQ